MTQRISPDLVRAIYHTHRRMCELSGAALTYYDFTGAAFDAPAPGRIALSNSAHVCEWEIEQALERQLAIA